jgi:DNA-directed RNA polymerase specialized sigma24 family protein
MKTLDFDEEVKLLNDLKRKNLKAFSRFYSEYSQDLLILAYNLLGDGSLCRKKVDELFTGLWEENKFANIQPPIHNYLYTELRKLCKSSLA